MRVAPSRISFTLCYSFRSSLPGSSAVLFSCSKAKRCASPWVCDPMEARSKRTPRSHAGPCRKQSKAIQSFLSATPSPTTAPQVGPVCWLTPFVASTASRCASTSLPLSPIASWACCISTARSGPAASARSTTRCSTPSPTRPPRCSTTRCWPRPNRRPVRPLKNWPSPHRSTQG